MKDIIALATPHDLMQTAPVQYLNWEGSSRELSEYVVLWGDRAPFCGGRRVLASVERHLVQSLEQSRIGWERVFFAGECSAVKIKTGSR